MSDATATPPPPVQPSMLRLLEPRALAGADRLAQRMQERNLPLVRGVSNGVARFADRIFDYWVGRTYDRAPMGATARSPQQLLFPFPWYEQQTVQRAARPNVPLAPNRVASNREVPTLVGGEHSQLEERALDLVNAHEGSPAAEPPGPASEASRGAPAARPGLAARLVERLGSVDAWLRRVLGPSAAPTPERLYSAAPMPTARRDAPPQLRFVELSASAPSVAGARDGATTPSTVAREPEAAHLAAAVANRAVLAPQGGPMLALSPGLPTAIPAASPRLQRFVEGLAGPTSLAQAGVIEPPAGVERAIQPFSGELVAPLDALSVDRVVRAAPAATSERIVSGSPIEPPRPSIAAAPAAAYERIASEPERPATLLGALASFSETRGDGGNDVVERWRPGRAAQRAELVARIAEQRIARQLGLAPEAPSPRSVRWSADAFTVVELAATAPASLGERPRSGALLGAPGFAGGAFVPGAISGAPVASSSSMGVSATLGTAAPVIGGASSAGATPTLGAPLVGTAPLTARSSRAAGVPVLPASALVEGASFDGARGHTRASAFERALVSPSMDFAPQPATARPAPLSVAALLAFADAQLGPRLLGGARPMPVRAPESVYVQPTELRSSGIQSSGMQPAGGQSSAARRPGTSTPPQGPGVSAASALSFTPALGAPTLAATFAYPPVATATNREPEPRVQELSVAQIGRRSEQLAGELGVRVGSLASEFMFDVVPEEQPAKGFAAQAHAAAMSTSEWVLLSMFPSHATATEVAQAIGARAAASSAASAAAMRSGPGTLLAPMLGLQARGGLAADSPTLGTSTLGMSSPGMPTLSLPAGAAPGTSTTGGVASMGGPNGSGFADAAGGSFTRRASLATPLVVERGIGLVGNTEGASAREGGGELIPAAAARVPLTAVLPDGRAPRGSRLLARAAMPTVSALPAGSSAVQAASEAASRRLEEPVGAPLWGHMRPLVEPSTSPAEPAAGSARAAALELVAPFVETARPTTGASSFAREAMPVVPARAPDDSTKSLVTALTAASTQGASDRLSVADLTLISIVSATEQVAASGRGATPSPAASAAAGGAGAAGRGGGPSRGRDAAEVKRIADMVREELARAETQKNNRGGR